MVRSTSESVPKAMQPAFDAVAALIDPFCGKHLDEEYRLLCRKLAAALCRKRPSPLAKGSLDIWACAIIHAIGTVNFLFDKSQTPHLRADQLCELFGVKKTTAGNKSRAIREMFDIGPFSPEWFRPSRMDDNPLAWMIMVDGFIVDVRTESRAVQEGAYRRGLIPYLPPSPPRR